MPSDPIAPITEDTWRLIASLEERRLLETRAARERRLVEILTRIGRSAQPEAISYLLPWTLTGAASAEAAALAIQELLRSVSIAAIPAFCKVARREMSYSTVTMQPWHALLPEALPSLAAVPGGNAVVALATLHRNGYVRESATRCLAGTPATSSLPLLLLRLNDWVEAVHRAAADGVRTYLAAPDPELLVDLLPLLQLGRRSRRDHRSWLEQVEACLQRPEAAAALDRGCRSHDRSVRRACCRLAIGGDSEATVEKLETALRDPDTVVRTMAAERLASLPGKDARRLLPIALGNAFMPVRRAAIQTLVTRWPREADDVLHTALLDRHAAIRDLARRHWQASTAGDPAEVYRDALRSPVLRVVRAAILGLGEMRHVDSAPAIAEFSSHPIADLRGAAVRALGQMDAVSHAAHFLAALADPSARVSREALTHLARDTALVSDLPLRRLVADLDAPEHAALNALRLLSTRSKWVALPHLLVAAASPCERLAERARAYLQKWLAEARQSFVKPTPDQTREIEAALSHARDRLPSELVTALRDEFVFWATRR